MLNQALETKQSPEGDRFLIASCNIYGTTHSLVKEGSIIAVVSSLMSIYVQSHPIPSNPIR